ncbi:ribonuclease catalytic domain-containing protein [Accumulibacter sp.]|uniref:ribonuclease catalytic domain-containing protein n=1 Tax=Accumulibacter sp. TaxID=2053492 RepID=UPI0025E356BE|nr:RNB domain-containing ribonuclease [Accumulibacter sp.]MCM8594612.1 RNB domain-containing ribonuclease [Accumulibacter sp.]MCM8627249.1 RNB domain-containing ribonuclease [Accumulibacter sp.]MDS4048758.1 RNB domain-containing ribonuclease [Accumulibacter sp.]
MHVLFEEEGAFRAATIVADNDTSLQVEAVSGKRSKIKSANVLLRFADPPPGSLLDEAESLANGMEPDFLWECVGENEFSFADFAGEYFGHQANAVEATALLLALHAAPIYFHRKGKGRFRRAPPEILQAALAGLERKRQQALAIERMVGELRAFTLPREFPPLLAQLLYRPDRNRGETRALELACAETGLSPVHLLDRCGAIRSAHDYHLQRFLFEQFPRGTAFPPTPEPAVPNDLPRAEVPAFSIDDAATTEIDDAFSLQALPGVGWRVGIHIAAPALGVAPQSPLDEVARARLSTVYLPGSKITMLPGTVLDAFTLSGGRDCPALSLYLTVTEAFEIVGHESRIERVPVVANLRHHDIEPLFNEQTIAAGLPDFAFRDELLVLWRLANACEGRRGKPAALQTNLDYNFRIDGDLADPESCRVEIAARRRGSPLDKLVAELMIVANSIWGGLLAARGVTAIYRVKTGGKVRMSTSPQPHEGLGVPQYAWSSSPLRRYVDLVNQWQLVACVKGETPPFAARSEALHAAVRDFELTYGAYADFQRSMERYWCLRWLRQEAIETIAATIGRENVARLDGLPLQQRVPSAPELKPGERIRLAIGSIDYLTLGLGCRYLETVSPGAAGEADGAMEAIGTAD